MEEQNKALAERFDRALFEEGNLGVANEILSPTFVLHSPHLPSRFRTGVDGAQQYASAIIAALPDRTITHHDVLAEGDKVATRWTVSGTHRGELLGIPPTGRQLSMHGFDLFRIEDGKIAELWQTVDAADALQQVGLMPPLSFAETQAGRAILWLAVKPRALAAALVISGIIGWFAWRVRR